jgi:hypothetical protein
LTLPDEFVGQRVKCPMCSLEFAATPGTIPAMEVDSAPPTVAAKPAEPPPLETPPPPILGAYVPAGAKARRPAANVPMMYCIECGTQFPKNAPGCPACGLAIEAMHEPAPRPARRTRPRDLPPYRAYLPLLSIILVVVGIGLFISAPVGDEMFRGGPRSFRTFFVIFGVTSGIVAEVASLICMTCWLYQAWRLVLHGDEEYSAGLMVGLLFVPFFNFFWIFRAVPGLSSAVREELRYYAPARDFGAGWTTGLLACIFAVIPYGQPIALCMFIAWMFIINTALQRFMRFHEEWNARRGQPAGDDDTRTDA